MIICRNKILFALRPGSVIYCRMINLKRVWNRGGHEPKSDPKVQTNQFIGLKTTVQQVIQFLNPNKTKTVWHKGH